MPPLDGLRGVAILLVLAYHFRPIGLPHVLNGIVGAGWAGVDLFFVLSGFLITGILLDTRECDNYFRSFWARRALRIFPLYFLALVLFLVGLPAVWPAAAGSLPPAADHIYYWIYLNNWTVLLRQGQASHILGHFWSLAVEEQFYFVWPLAVFLIPRRQLAPAALAGAGLVTAARAIAAGQDGGEWIYRNTLLRADGLLLGAAAAAWLRQPGWPRRLAAWAPRMAWAAAGVAVAGFLAAGGTYYQRPLVQALVYPALACLAASLVVLAIPGISGASRAQERLAHPALRALGRYSYGLYVWHWPVAYGVQQTGGGWAACVAGLGVSLLAAWISYECFEGPILARKRCFAPRHSGPQERCLSTWAVSAGTTSNRSPTMP